ncbi:beta-galactosidase [Herbaspirillum sp. Sphag1AN]|uniref:beta-galactosidase n=1 Tax=unclassified Herbaspirillum TaxID=2624150 RepID=UPI00160AF8F2|nr:MULTISPECIES: beta-galactosidase [unclassified Herbaspirillum]MBB3213528.1 beta-galactosidase [Herbaspirillum sp. Sphag1AN]MBB3246726.1 beta-galactosidase [Herbaspirillum sp. Sphag64]
MSIRLGVCYYPEHWSEEIWRSDAQRMVALGIRQVRIGEFAWSRIEPEPGHYAWGWLDRAIEVLATAGLEVVMCTPTATPPKWLIDQYPDILPIDANGRPRSFGSRRHYDFSSPSYYAQSQRIVTLLAQRYGKHPAISAWQIDNEFGCHHTVVSYSAAAQAGFRRWLQQRYQSIEALNAAWGTVFWSGEYRSFEEVDAPVCTVTEAHPSHRLDYRRFASDEVARYNRMQVDILRAHAPARLMVHNFMQMFLEFDHYPVAADLDVASWDSYPLGALEEMWFSPDDKARWLRTGHPDFASFNHDLYRGMSAQPFWVMEQQPGPVNWAQWNPMPLPGMVRLWSWEAFAHGAGCVSYFRWRQVPFAQEQMHAGLNTPDNQLDVGGQEAAQVAQEISKITQANGPLSQPRGQVALLFDYAAKWLFEIHPQGADFQYHRIAFDYYSALRALGLDVDILPTTSERSVLNNYAMIVVPPLPILPPGLADDLAASGAQVVIGPRSGSKTDTLQIPEKLPPGALQQVLPIRVWRVESLRPNIVETVTADDLQGQAAYWRDLIETGAGVETLARFDDQHPAIVHYRGLHYLASVFDADFTRSVLQRVAHRAGLSAQCLPEGLRVSQRGGLQFAVNYSNVACNVPAGERAEFLVGSRHLEPQGVAIYRA